MGFDIKDKEPLWGKWFIKEELGTGAFGKVFKLYSDNDESALKQIDILYSGIDEKRAYIEGITEEGIEYYYKALLYDSLAELKIMKSLGKCENIVSFKEYEVVEEIGQGFHILIRLELLKPFVKYICENRPDIKTIIKLGIDICKALEVCHTNNIIHRDIKPDNIFYCEKSNLFKLGDFGIAIDLNTPTMINGRPGTLTHMSPEVYKGKDYTFCDDVYALGIILYKLLNFNRLPLMPDYPENITPLQRNKAVYDRLKGEKIPLPALCDDKNYELCNVVRKAISEDESERYKTASDFKKALEDSTKNGFGN